MGLSGPLIVFIRSQKNVDGDPYGFLWFFLTPPCAFERFAHWHTLLFCISKFAYHRVVIDEGLIFTVLCDVL